ncbi:MAG: abortive infection family protein, partial [Sphaerospermopsis kisseleviana]
MEKLKELIQQYHRWQGLKDYVEKIEYFKTFDFPSAIGNAKALIESICKTILDEQKTYEYKTNDSVNKLVTETIKTLNINLTNGVATFGSGLITASQNLGELRNRIDTSSHGQSLLTSKDNQIEELTAYFLISS